jgi:ubiquinone/menaquinone biosynthesis C-methylase UbiE
MSQNSQQPQYWNPVYDGHARSTILDQIRRESYGDDYDEELKANSMVMLSELRWCIQALRLAPGSAFIDLGCGQGGPSLWVARETDARVTGIDLSSNALSYARKLSASFVAVGRANYFVGDVTRLPLNDRSYSAVLSIDVFQLLPDKPGAFAELARVMRPDARLALTTRERHSSDTKVVIETIVADYEPLLAAAGFELLERHEPAGWEERHRRYYLRVLEMRDAISAEAGEDFAGRMVRDAQNVLSMLPGTRRVLIVARRIG